MIDTSILFGAIDHAFYAQYLRGSMFTGFLTLSGFLFSGYTFIIIHMKRELYESDQYKKRIAKFRTANKKMTYFGPLRRLSRVLLVTVICSLAASVSQFTIGLIDTQAAVSFCFGIAGVAILGVVVALFLMGMNLKQWFSDLEETALKSEEVPKSK